MQVLNIAPTREGVLSYEKILLDIVMIFY